MDKFLSKNGLEYFYQKISAYFVKKSELISTGANILDLYPVGSVYLTTSNTAPATLLGGGTWTRIGYTSITSQCLVGVDPNDSAFDESLMTGGGHITMLDATQIPDHTHTYTSYTTRTGRKGSSSNAGITIISTQITSDTTAAGVDNTPGFSYVIHNNNQPYIKCHIWRRTA